MNLSQIRAALETHLLTLPGLPVGDNGKPIVSWENVQFLPPDEAGLWLRTTLIPSESYGRTVGDNPTVRFQGLFQIDVFAPDGLGPGAAENLADNVMGHYRSGTRLFHGDASVTTLVPSRGAGFVTGIWYQLPVTVYWYSHVKGA